MNRSSVNEDADANKEKRRAMGAFSQRLELEGFASTARSEQAHGECTCRSQQSGMPEWMLKAMTRRDNIQWLMESKVY
jgi:hypothetical protein